MLPSVSLCMIVKNEAQHLARCLASVQPLAQEIIVVDTGSTDATREIASHFTDQVLPFEWCDNFAAARNLALQQATSDWVLSLDADEWLPSEMQTPLRAEIQSHDPACPLVLYAFFEQGHHRLRKHLAWTHHHGIAFQGRVHEGLRFADGTIPPQQDCYQLVLPHETPSPATMLAKQQGYQSLIEAELKLDTPCLRRQVELYWHLAQAQAVLQQPESYQLALENAAVALLATGPEAKGFDYQVLIQACAAQFEATLQHGHPLPTGLLKRLNTAIRLLPRQAEGWLLLAQLHYWQGNVTAADSNLQQARKCLPRQGMCYWGSHPQLAAQSEFLAVRLLGAKEQWLAAVVACDALYDKTRSPEVLLYRVYLALCQGDQLAAQAHFQHLSAPNRPWHELLWAYTLWTPAERLKMAPF